MATIVGKAPQHIKQCTCRECASIIEYTLSETTEQIHCDYGGGREIYKILKCPSCGYEINVSH